MLRYIIYLLEVFNTVEHLINLVVRFLRDGLAVDVNVLVKFLQVARGELSVSLDLLHQVIGEQGHLMLGLHDLLDIDNMGDIADDQKLIFATSYVYIYLIKRDVLLIKADGWLVRIFIETR